MRLYKQLSVLYIQYTKINFQLNSTISKIILFWISVYPLIFSLFKHLGRYRSAWSGILPEVIKRSWSEWTGRNFLMLLSHSPPVQNGIKASENSVYITLSRQKSGKIGIVELKVDFCIMNVENPNPWEFQNVSQRRFSNILIRLAAFLWIFVGRPKIDFFSNKGGGGGGLLAICPKMTILKWSFSLMFVPAVSKDSLGTDFHAQIMSWGFKHLFASSLFVHKNQSQGSLSTRQGQKRVKMTNQCVRKPPLGHILELPRDQRQRNRPKMKLGLGTRDKEID